MVSLSDRDAPRIRVRILIDHVSDSPSWRERAGMPP
jgi:hypothetical protein